MTTEALRFKRLPKHKNNTTGSASVEFALFFVVITPLFLSMIAMFNWLFFIKEVSVFEHTWANQLPITNENVVETGWDGIAASVTNWVDFLAGCEQRFLALLNESNIRNSTGLFLRIDVWRLSFNSQTGELQSASAEGNREVWFNKQTVSAEYRDYLSSARNLVINSVFAQPTSVPVEGLVMHYDFGPTVFGDANEINFFPFKLLVTYYLEAEPRSEALQRSLNFISSLVGIQPFVYSASRIIVLS